MVQSIFVPTRNSLTLWLNVSGFIDIGVERRQPAAYCTAFLHILFPLLECFSECFRIAN